MINEPDSGAGGGEEDVFGEPGVIHVTPQDKEAIERVKSNVIRRKVMPSVATFMLSVMVHEEPGASGNVIFDTVDNYASS